LAFSPAHITGIFTIKNGYKNPFKKGSLGAGVSLKLGVYTTVEVEKNNKWKTKIKINNKENVDTFVSSTLLQEYFKLAQPHLVHVNHKIEVPVGAGYGTSGAAALSLSLALNEALDVGLSKIEAAQLAHLAEIKCKTGLGTVLAETFGGVELRVKAGAPGFGLIKKINSSNNFKVISVHFGSLPTKNYLSNKSFRLKVNKLGNKLVKKLTEKPALDNFMYFSRRFADGLNLYTEKLREVLGWLDSHTSQIFTMNMFGEAIFSLVEEENLPKMVQLLQFCKNFGGEVIVSEIDQLGARLIG